MSMLSQAMGDMSKEEIADLLLQQKEQFDKDGNAEILLEKDPLGPGRWVTLHCLQSRELNGCTGEIIQTQNADGRIGVRIPQGDKLIKATNMHPFPEDSIVKIARIGARGEEVAPNGIGGVRTWHWPRRVLDELDSKVSPISVLIGVPLHVAKVKAHKKLDGDSAFDNYYGTNFMVSPSTGLAAVEWQALVGPVIMWRPGGEPFSADDACLVQEFISTLLRRQQHSVSSDLQSAITPAAFKEFARLKLEQEKLNPLAPQSDDVNIL